jgi:hypothetical protein
MGITHSTDFWWLSSDQETRYIYAELGHHNPIPPDEQPDLASWDKEVYLTNQINHWRERFQNTNVYRSLKLTTALSEGEELIAPFVVDIDNDREDLADALDVARNALSLLQGWFNITEENLKIFFTGHKGFNLEMHPEALGRYRSINDQIATYGGLREEIIQGLRRRKSDWASNQVSYAETVIDTTYIKDGSGYKLKHHYIRLHRSLNKWGVTDGTIKARMKIELSVDELNRLTATEIIAMSENFAF